MILTTSARCFFSSRTCLAQLSRRSAVRGDLHDRGQDARAGKHAARDRVAQVDIAGLSGALNGREPRHQREVRVLGGVENVLCGRLRARLEAAVRSKMPADVRRARRSIPEAASIARGRCRQVRSWTARSPRFSSPSRRPWHSGAPAPCHRSHAPRGYGCLSPACERRPSRTAAERPASSASCVRSSCLRGHTFAVTARRQYPMVVLPITSASQHKSPRMK